VMDGPTVADEVAASASQPVAPPCRRAAVPGKDSMGHHALRSVHMGAVRFTIKIRGRVGVQGNGIGCRGPYCIL